MKNKYEMSPKVSNKIYYLYFILTFMILSIHSLKIDNFVNANEFSINFNRFFNILFNMGVSTFFVLSAFLFYYKDDSLNYFEVILKKIKTLIIPYFLWNIIACPLKILKDYIIMRKLNIDVANIFVGLLNSEWNQVLWFLRVLFAYIMIFPLIKWLCKKKIVCPILIVAIIVLNCYLGPITGYSTVRYWLPTYLLGSYLIINYKEKIFRNKSLYKNKMIGFLTLVVFILFWIYAYSNNYGLYLFRMFSPFLIWYLCDFLLLNKKPCWFVKQTFFYYGFQLFIADFIALIYVKIFGNGSIQLILGTFILPTINITIMFLVAYILNKYFHRLYCLLTGNRGEKKMQKEKKELKICLVGSSGGHLTHLTMLNEFYKNKNRFWVTFNKTDANSILKDEKVYHCYFPTNRNIFNLFRNTFLAIKVILKERPNLIISSGAAVAVPFFYIGKIFGAKLIYIEVFDRIDKSTLTGKLVYPITDKFIVQWEEMKKVYPKAINLGSIF